MRFKVSELLLATTVAAIYAMGFSYLLRIEGRHLPRSDAWYLSLTCVGFILFALLIANRNFRLLGRVLVGWKSENWWVPHLTYFVIFACCVAVSAWRGQSINLVFPLLCAVQHSVFLFANRVACGENGVLLGFMFVSWDEDRLRLSKDARHLELSRVGRFWPPGFPLWSQRVAVPAAVSEDVRALVETKQRPKTKATDEYG